MNIEIKSFSDLYKLCVVTTKSGYSYATTWRIERDEAGHVTSPTILQVKSAWSEDRSPFQPFNGVYIFPTAKH